MKIAVNIKNIFGKKKRTRNANHLKLDKLSLIDFACQNYGIESLADLGGIWGVNGGYTIYAMKKHGIKRAFLVDTDVTKETLDKARKFSGLTIINENFGTDAVVQKIGAVDAIIMFDVLLHQVNPNWDKVLEMYASTTRVFIIYNQQFIGSDKTVRLFDLGYEGFFQNVPRTKDDPLYKEVFEKMYEMHPQHKRIWRDIHNIWQWGIVDDDLFAKMTELGFRLQYYRNCGQFYHLNNFENHAFVFMKSRQKY